VKWAAALGSCVPFVTRTLTLECATVDVVVDGGRAALEVVGEFDAALK
jgi:hypothetical protein